MLDRSEVLAGLSEKQRALIPAGCPQRLTCVSLSEALRMFREMWRMKLDMRWRVETRHKYGGNPLRPKGDGDDLLFSYPDRNLDCGLCGPRRRARLVDEIITALDSDCLYLTYDYSIEIKDRDSLNRSIERSKGRSVSVPTSRGRLILSTVLPIQRHSRTSIEWESVHLDELATWIVSLWWSDGRQVSSIPRGLLKSQRKRAISGEYTRGDAFGQPGKLISHLIENDDSVWQSGPITGIPRWSRTDLDDVLERHAKGEFNDLEPYELDVLEGGTR